jgi:hypothetical protein
MVEGNPERVVLRPRFCIPTDPSSPSLWSEWSRCQDRVSSGHECKSKSKSAYLFPLNDLYLRRRDNKLPWSWFLAKPCLGQPCNEDYVLLS